MAEVKETQVFPGLIGRPFQDIPISVPWDERLGLDPFMGAYETSRGEINKRENPSNLLSYHILRQHYTETLTGKRSGAASVPAFDMGRLIRDWPWTAEILTAFFVGVLLGEEAFWDQAGKGASHSAMSPAISRITEKYEGRLGMDVSIDIDKNPEYLGDFLEEAEKQVQALRRYLGSCEPAIKSYIEETMLCSLAFINDVSSGTLDPSIEVEIGMRFKPNKKSYARITRDFSLKDLESGATVQQLREKSVFRELHGMERVFRPFAVVVGGLRSKLESLLRK